MIYESDHQTSMRQSVPSAMRGANTLAIVDALASQAQLLEDICFDYAVTANVDEAVGVLLDRFAAFVGEARGLLTDSELRRILRAKIAALRLPPTPETLLSLLPTLVDAESYYYTGGHGFYQLAYASPTTPSSTAFARRALRLLRLAKPAGVETEMVAGTTNLFLLDRSNLDSLELGSVI
jgi:hypothetical protein